MPTILCIVRKGSRRYRRNDGHVQSDRTNVNNFNYYEDFSVLSICNDNEEGPCEVPVRLDDQGEAHSQDVLC